MVILKTSREIAKMRHAGRISQRALQAAGKAVEPGVSTYEIDCIVREYIEKQGAAPSFLGYGGFPASACISVNNVVIHGIPSRNEILKQGDIVSIDVGAYFEGYHGDNAWTFPCEARSYSVVRKFVGHGVGAKLHEDPSVPNYGMSHMGVRLLPGMTIAIEPMINQGDFKVRILNDGWTTVTADGKLSAHFEHTVAITPDGAVILTSAD